MEDYGKLIFFGIVFVVYVLYGWWKSRQQQEEETNEPWPGQASKPPGSRPGQAPGAPAPRPLATSWEEELRRLLGEAPPAPPPPPRPTPPALPANRPNVPQPARHSAPRRVPEPPAPVPVGIEGPDAPKARAVRMPSLEVSAQAFLRASQLESQVAERLHRVQERVITHRAAAAVTKKEAAPEIHQALGLFRNRSSQRAAIVAAVVLGPPRALEA